MLETIYFGGGTPSLLSAAELEALFVSITAYFHTSGDPEITLECHPDDLTPEKLQILRGLGVNRLSIGMQSFHEDHLYFLHRLHTARQGIEAYETARETGFDNISIDLIYGIPSPDLTIWRQDLRQAIDLAPEHISAYCLTIEPKTVFGVWTKKGQLQAMDEDAAAIQFEVTLETLGEAGYHPYEISNFAKPGFHSRHNTAYWAHLPYLGVGPGAHSFNGSTRYLNVPNNYKYIQTIIRNKLPNTEEVLTPQDLANEYLMTSLRTFAGCNLEKLHKKYGYDLIGHSKKNLVKWEKAGFLTIDQGRVQLTTRGKLLADEITADLYWA